MDKKLFNSK